MAHPFSGTTVLTDTESIIIVPFSIVTMIYTNLLLCFATWEYDSATLEEREICCIRIEEQMPAFDPDNMLPRAPILFEVIGQIVHDDCFLTADGYEAPESSRREDEHLATCWVETRYDYISRIYWLGIGPAVQEISNHLPGDVDTSRLIAEEDGGVKLQVCYQPPAGQSLASTLPLYNVHGQHQVPSSIAEVPFGRPVRVAFALESSFFRDDPQRSRSLIAVLEHMVVV